jgi:hypothetical protein
MSFEIKQEFLTHASEIVHIDYERGYVLSMTEIEDSEEFTKYWWQVTTAEGDQFYDEMRHYTYQPNLTHVLSGVENLFLKQDNL